MGMPIMSAQQQNDARGTTRLLALAASDSIHKRSDATSREVVLNNVYRLLEAYRANAFFGLEPRARRFPARATEAISLLPRQGRHVREVRAALEEALAAAFPGRPKEEAIGVIEDVLRGITYPQQFEKPSDDDCLKAGRFFDGLVSRLNVR
jgi:hypothetical protein